MRVAFHAPLKPVDHPTASGDRRVARGFVDLLQRLGHEVVIPSRFRPFDRSGDAARQQRLGLLAPRLAARVIRRLALAPPDLWFTYHCHHKAPDLLGPAVCDAFGIPYVIAEGSISRRQEGGPWSVGWAQAHRALTRADLVLAMTARDSDGLATRLPRAKLALFPPFLDAARFQATPRVQSPPIVLAVGMMRQDVKQRSHLMVLEVMARLTDLPWRLLLAGDGPARPAIEEKARLLLGERCTFLGALTEERMLALYQSADFLLWPGFGEAYGMAVLEAQASGLPVVAGREGGIPELVQDGVTGLLAPADDAAALAAAVRGLLVDPTRRMGMGNAALRLVASRHDVPAAARRLGALLAPLLG